MAVQLLDPDDNRRLESPDPAERLVAASRLISRLDQVSRELQHARAMAAAELHARGWSYREVGELIGVSAQRVGQMVGRVEGASQLIHAWAELDRKLRILAQVSGIALSGVSPARLIAELHRAGTLEEDERDTLATVLDARNRGVHVGQVPSDEEVESLLDEVIPLSAKLEMRLQNWPPEGPEAMTRERLEAEQLLTRVRAEFPDRSWQPGRCEECGRAIPVPQGDEIWVCSSKCLKDWRQKLYQLIDPGSQEEVMTLVPKVVPYWL
jgi:ribosomal protein L37AE/L43A